MATFTEGKTVAEKIERESSQSYVYLAKFRAEAQTNMKHVKKIKKRHLYQECPSFSRSNEELNK